MKYEDFLEEVKVFQDPEATVADRTDKTLQIIDVYKEKLERLAELEEKNAQYEKQVQDLTHAQSIMYRRLGAEAEKELEPPPMQQKTITLEDIENGMVK